MRLGSMFSGYGGLDDALTHVLGARVVWHAEKERAPSMVLERAFPGVPNLGDVTKVDWVTAPPVDVLAGGSPCQDVSAAGHRVGMRPGTRSGLWASMCDAVELLRPRLVVWENVRGVVSAGANSAVEPCPGCVGDGPSDGRAVLRALGRVVGDLASIGYDAVWCGLRASDVGAPHGRYRVFLFAWPSDADPFGRGWDGWSHVQVGVTKGRAAAAGAGENVSGGARSGAGVITLLPTPRASDGVNGGPNQAGSSGDEMLPSAVMRLLPALGASTSEETASTFRARARAVRSQDAADEVLTGPVMEGFVREKSRWREYAPAVRRWEQVLGRPAPEPLAPNKNGQPRLSPAFSEWMMGIPTGRVTDPSLGLSRVEQLTCIGNGVVTLQAVAAARWFLQVGYPAAMRERERRGVPILTDRVASA